MVQSRTQRMESDGTAAYIQVKLSIHIVEYLSLGDVVYTMSIVVRMSWLRSRRVMECP